MGGCSGKKVVVGHRGCNPKRRPGLEGVGAREGGGAGEQRVVGGCGDVAAGVAAAVGRLGLGKGC